MMAGRFLVTSTATPGSFHVFGPNGQYLRSIGRDGGGPGEFRMPLRPAVSPNGTVVVPDLGNARLAVFTTNLEIDRYITLPAARDPRAVFDRDGRLFLAASILSPNRIGLPLHRLDSRGAIELSFGSERTVVTPATSVDVRRRVAPSADGGIWTSRVDEYVIERWSADGILQQRLVRDAGWFRAVRQVSGSPAPTPPQPHIVALQEDRSGLVWVLTSVADLNWKPMSVRQVAGEDAPSPAEMDGLYDTILEVLDPESGRVVVARRVPYLLRGFAGEDLIYRYRERSGGNPVYEVLRVRLTS